MKSKLLFLSFLMLLTITANYAQSSASASGIAVQGIARDNNNTALANESITFRFTIYYNNPAPVNVYVENTAISTDAFGVFSHVLNVDPTTNSSFANNILLLKIEDVSAGTIISDEIFKHVPYAISANNGVPTGSIMPYIGTSAPAGWVLCDGQALNVINGSADLIALVGANAPNLQGMFLRGTGTSPVNSEDGPALKGTQGDGFESHNHPASATTNGAHTHNTNVANDGAACAGIYQGGGNEFYQYNQNGGKTSTSAGNHSHTITTNYVGTNETRPVNYGVNYIIKL